MGHNCFYDIRIGFKGKSKEIFLTYIAKWKNKSLDVIKVYESKKVFTRDNLYFSRIGGYLVEFPGEKECYYHGNGIAGKYRYFEIEYKFRPNLSNVSSLNLEMKNCIIENRPELTYLINKYKGNDIIELFDLINIYKKHPEVESLVDKGLYRIALDSRLWFLKKEKQCEVIHFIKNNNLSPNVNLSNVFFALKNNCTIDEAIECSSMKCNIETVRYCKKQKESLRFYKDYIEMANELGKNLKDPYWLFPKSLRDMHRKVMKEKIEIESNKRKAFFEKYKVSFESMLKVNSKCNQVLNGFEFRLPIDENDIVEQANILNQCLITCSYDKKYAKFQTVLIFVIKDDCRIATAEIGWDKKIKQFYGNEIDRKNCTPSNEVREVFEKYLSSFQLKKPKKTAMVYE